MNPFKSLFLCFVITFCGNVMWGQCPQGAFFLETQAEVDNFAVLYPDCTEIDSLTIGKFSMSSNISNINSLSQITLITSYLWIGRNPNLNTFSGLDNVTSIEGNVSIRNNDNLISFSGLDNVTSIEGYMSISNNDNLISFSGLDNVTTIGSLSIRDNDNLSNLSGLESLTLIGCGLHLENTSVSTLSALENLTSIGCNVYFGNNDNLTDFSGLENLISVGGLYIENNDNIIDFGGLENLTSIGADLLISNNVSLIDFSGLENVTALGSNIEMRLNTNLVSLSGLQNIVYNTVQYIYMRDNPALSVCSLPNVCDYLENGKPHSISNNATNCNSLNEILDACDALPIELDKLQVHLENKTAVLTWRTLSETNNAGFEIQGSKDGTAWERIGWQQGKGNSLTPHTYTYRDENPFFGTSYYRFKQVDFNGDFKYSNVVSLQYIRPGITIFPNPNTGIFNIQSTAQGTYQILNTSGQIIRQGEMENDISLDISTEAQGVYFISVTIDKETFVKRMIKM